MSRIRLLSRSLPIIVIVGLLLPSHSTKAVYPNPFTEGTTFQLTMPRDAPIRITVYDLLGKPIRTLFEGLHAKGQYDVPWDGKDTSGNAVQPGVYICVLFSDGVAVKPVKVIKVAA